MTTALQQAVTGRSTAVATKAKPADIHSMLQVWGPEIARALPRHMNVDRVSRIALTEIRRTPALGECNPLSLFASIISAAQMGLEIGGGRCFLIPFKGECTLVPGWKGLVDLANRSGRSSCWTGAVFEGDEFEFALGDSPFVQHKPMGEDSPDRLTHVYAVGRIKGSDWPIVEVWPIAKIQRHRDRYNKQGGKHYSYKEPEMYARKIPLLQVLKYLPTSAELEAALILSGTEESGQGLTLEGVLAGGNVTLPEPPPVYVSTGDAGDAPDESDRASIDAEAAAKADADAQATAAAEAESAARRAKANEAVERGRKPRTPAPEVAQTPAAPAATPAATAPAAVATPPAEPAKVAPPGVDVNAALAAAETRGVDTHTGEIFDGAEASSYSGPRYTYAQVLDGINQAKSVQALNVVRDLIRGVPDNAQRAELHAAARAKAATLP